MCDTFVCAILLQQTIQCTYSPRGPRAAVMWPRLPRPGQYTYPAVPADDQVQRLVVPAVTAVAMETPAAELVQFGVVILRGGGGVSAVTASGSTDTTGYSTGGGGANECHLQGEKEWSRFHRPTPPNI